MQLFSDSDVVLETRPWPRGALRQNFMALAVASGPMSLASKVQVLALRAALTIFLALPSNLNKLKIAIIINL